MKITYNNEDDILNIEFKKGEIIKDISYGWNVNLAFTAEGIAGITILDAKANGYLTSKAKSIDS